MWSRIGGHRQGNMSKQRKKRPGARRQVAKQPPPAQRSQSANTPLPPPPKYYSWWGRARQAWRLIKIPIVFGVGLIAFGAGLNDLWGPFWPTVPYVEPAAIDPASPFSLPFSVKNRSILFTDHAVTYRCVFGRIDLISKDRFRDFTVGGKVTDTLLPSSIVNFSCRMQMPPNTVTAVALTIYLHYNIQLLGLTLPLRYSTPLLTWVSTSDGGHWVVGKIGP